jgi:hypothetical protein
MRYAVAGAATLASLFLVWLSLMLLRDTFGFGGSGVALYIPALLGVLVAAGAVGVIRRQSWAGYVLGGTAVLILVGTVGWYLNQPRVLSRGGDCDNAVPVWRADCGQMPALLEYVWPPERWTAPTYCDDSANCSDEEARRGAQLRAEWIRIHGAGSVAR